MIKRCKQCGGQLKSDESNNICENCRKIKRGKQADARILAAELKKKKYR